MNLAVVPLTISKQMEKIVDGYVLLLYTATTYSCCYGSTSESGCNAMIISFAATGRFCFGRNDVTAYFLWHIYKSYQPQWKEKHGHPWVAAGLLMWNYVYIHVFHIFGFGLCHVMSFFNSPEIESTII